MTLISWPAGPEARGPRHRAPDTAEDDERRAAPGSGPGRHAAPEDIDDVRDGGDRRGLPGFTARAD